MPNWCLVSVTVRGKKENVKRLYDDFKRVLSIKRSGDPMYLSSESNWLGHIVKECFGLDPNTDDCPRCRGRIIDSYQDIYEIYSEEIGWDFSYEHAWSPAFNFNIMLRKFYDVDVAWSSEEPGMGCYLTNDTNRVCLFSRFEDTDEYEFSSEKEMLEDARDYINNELDIDEVAEFDNIKDFIDFVNRNDIDVEFGTFEYINDSEYFTPMNNA